MNKPAAIYARVSSDRQKENHTIASQTAALIEYAQKNGYSVPPEWVFQDEGYSGAILVRPGLEALRDLAAEGQIAAVLVYSPDRLSRKYAYQEWRRYSLRPGIPIPAARCIRSSARIRSAPPFGWRWCDSLSGDPRTRGHKWLLACSSFTPVAGFAGFGLSPPID